MASNYILKVFSTICTVIVITEVEFATKHKVKVYALLSSIHFQLMWNSFEFVFTSLERWYLVTTTKHSELKRLVGFRKQNETEKQISVQCIIGVDQSFNDYEVTSRIIFPTHIVFTISFLWVLRTVFVLAIRIYVISQPFLMNNKNLF